MDAHQKDEKEIIRLCIVDDNDCEIKIDDDNLKFCVKLEISNTEDLNFILSDIENEIFNGTIGEGDQDEIFLDDFKIDVIEDLKDLLEELDDPEESEAEDGSTASSDNDNNRIIDESHSITTKKKTTNENKNQRKTYVCKHCGYKSLHKSHYRRHLRNHTKPNGWFCCICKKEMSGKHDLKIHTEEHRCPDNPNRFKCNECSYTSNKLANVGDHTNVHIHPNKELECSRCNFIGKNKSEIKKHCYEHVGFEKDVKCPVCLETFESLLARRQHMLKYKTRTTPSRFKCPECAYMTPKVNNFKQHMVVHRNEYEIEMFKCSYCPFKSKRKTDLRQHELVKHKPLHEVTLFPCDFCSYNTRRGNHLTNHMRNCHQDELVIKKCGLCSYKSVSQVLIEKHCSIHSKLPDGYYLCSICGFNCTTSSELDKHLCSPRTQESEEPEKTIKEEIVNEEEDIGYSFELVKMKVGKSGDEKGNAQLAMFCCQFPNCSFSTDIERDAQIHVMICHNRKGVDNKCPECSFHTTCRYIYIDHLKVHQINIEHLKPHLCEVCGARWLRQGDLTRHMWTHWGTTGETRMKITPTRNHSNKKLLRCTLCNYETRIRLCLYKHMKKHGNIVQENFNDCIKDEEFEEMETC